jgi:hypothetical protein
VRQGKGLPARPVISPSRWTLLREPPLPKSLSPPPRSTGCAPRLSCVAGPRTTVLTSAGLGDGLNVRDGISGGVDVAPRAAVGGGSRRTEASSTFARRLDLPGPLAVRALGLHPVLIGELLSLCASSRAVGAARRRLQEELRACQLRGRGTPGGPTPCQSPAATRIPARPALPWTRQSSSVAKLLFLMDKATNEGILPRKRAVFR